MKTKYVLVLMVFFALLTACRTVGQTTSLPPTTQAVDPEAALQELVGTDRPDWNHGLHAMIDGKRVTITVTTQNELYPRKLCVGETMFPMFSMVERDGIVYHGLLIEAHENGVRISTAVKEWDFEKEVVTEAKDVHLVGEFETSLPWIGVIEIRGERIWSFVRLNVVRC